MIKSLPYLFFAFLAGFAYAEVPTSTVMDPQKPFRPEARSAFDRQIAITPISKEREAVSVTAVQPVGKEEKYFELRFGPEQVSQITISVEPRTVWNYFGKVRPVVKIGPDISIFTCDPSSDDVLISALQDVTKNAGALPAINYMNLGRMKQVDSKTYCFSAIETHYFPTVRQVSVSNLRGDRFAMTIQFHDGSVIEDDNYEVVRFDKKLARNNIIYPIGVNGYSEGGRPLQIRYWNGNSIASFIAVSISINHF